MSQHILLRALSKTLAMRIALCTAVLVALMELLAMLDQLSPILDRHLGLAGVVRYVILHMPALIVEIMPLSVLIGSLFMLTRMSLSSEISALRAAGLSPAGLYRLLLPVTLATGVVASIGQYAVVPYSERALAIWWNKTDPDAARTTAENHVLWLRSGPTLIRIGQIADGGALLRDVSFYHRDASGLLTATQHSDDMRFVSGAWVSGQTQGMTLSPDMTSAMITTETPQPRLDATPGQIMSLSLPQAFHTPGQFLHILYGGGTSSLPRASYRMAMFAGLFLPLQMAMMVLISLPVIYIPPRAGLRNPLPVYALALGLGYIILQGMISALGNAGTIPALFATGAGPLLGALLGLSWLVRLEE